MPKAYKIKTGREIHEIWPKYAPENFSVETVLCLVNQVNEHFRERIPVWEHFIEHPQHFSHFMDKVFRLSLAEQGLSFADQTAIILFFNNCFNSMEVEIVRKEVGKVCSLPVWINLLPERRNKLLEKSTKIKKLWVKVEKKFEKMPKEEFEAMDFNRRFFWILLQKFKATIDYIDDESKEVNIDAVDYCEHFLLLLIDLEAQLTTRRFLNELILSSHVITHCLLSQFVRSEYGTLFCDLLELLKFYARFEIDDLSGEQLTATEVVKRHYNQMMDLQKATFFHFRDDHNSIADFANLSVGSVDGGKFLRKHLGSLDIDQLYKIAEYLLLVPPRNEADKNNNGSRLNDPKYILEEIVFCCEKRPSQLQRLNSEPLYPSEDVIWDEKLVPYDSHESKTVLPLNRLNIQFLTLHDYLMRNFNLFKVESTYEIRSAIEDILFRMKPMIHESGDENEVVWGGWARMALPIAGTRIVSVAKPLVGETAPAEVKADIQITLPRRTDFRDEWQGLRRNDVLFLLKVVPKHPVGHKFDSRLPFGEQFHVAAVRGCEVEGILGAEGHLIDEFDRRDAVRKLPGEVRTFRVKLDPNQYQLDADRGLETDLYFSFNLLMRRDAKTNNFKSVLGTIRQLLNTEFVIPDWLHEIILGYGEPDAAHYSKINGTIPSVDFNDTFLSLEHLKNSFPGREIVVPEGNPLPPYRLTFKEFEPQHNIQDPSQRDRSIVVEHQKKFNRVVTEQFHTNQIEFTPVQVEAIKAGMQPGLTIVVGPPGTGKTDVAVQIISNIYHNWPEQRTLIVTHSNQALNALFEKIINLDVDERHLLRMGHGEESLETTKDFSRYGRVDYVLAERIRLLRQVEILRESMNEIGDVAYSCETAGYFFRYNVYKTWEYFTQGFERLKMNMEKNDDTSAIENLENYVSRNFPFGKFYELLSQNPDFAHIAQPVQFSNNKNDWEVALEAWARVQDIFKKLDEFRAFELLRNGRERADYLLVKEAKIIAMTCTYAALRRQELVELGFRYDNILMEEAAQILEIETFIPLLLQDPHDGRYRLKRWIMIGDHNQLPPIVQNVCYQKFANLEQSLFTRFIRLGVPHVELDAQGRARKEISALYSWRYKQLGDLPHVLRTPEFLESNPGFLHTFQMIDVPDFNGVGETTPSSYFYQNLGEAEYAVALFIYMRIIGYPADQIAILTTYNGQAALIRDIVLKRCAENPLIGEPAKISTVDRFQGQQRNYIILSLVRTKNVGHIRDVRRLIVALSRARLGLYVLGRLSLFRSCYELRPALNRLCTRPTQLELLPNEVFENDVPRRKLDSAPSGPPLRIVDTVHMSQFVAEFYNSNVELLKERLAAEERAKALKEAELKSAMVANQEASEEVQNMDIVPSSSVSQQQQSEVLKGEQSSVAVQPEVAANTSQQATEKAESAIVFEQIDFERLKEIPKY